MSPQTLVVHEKLFWSTFTITRTFRNILSRDNERSKKRNIVNYKSSSKLSTVIFVLLFLYSRISLTFTAARSIHDSRNSRNNRAGASTDTRRMIDESKLRVGVKHRPRDCRVKSKHGDFLVIDYDAKVLYGKTNKTVDSSYERETPFRFRLGHGMLIPGLENSLFRMCAGERRKVVVPPAYAYGSVGAGHDVPPDSTLEYNVELLKIVEGNSEQGKRMGTEMWWEEVKFDSNQRSG